MKQLKLKPKKKVQEIVQNVDFSKLSYFGKVKRLMEMQLNVLLIGGTGVGKTSMIETASNELDLNVRKFSAPTMDPYSDLAGIPIPNIAEHTIDFLHDNTLDEYEMLFIDELNRPGQPKVLDGCLELVQFGTVNDRPLKKLKMVWAAMNPPNQRYIVEDIDPALLDRFDCYLQINENYDKEFFEKKYGKLGIVMINWVHALEENQRSNISPRRLDYICDISIKSNGDPGLIRSSIFAGSITEASTKVLLNTIAIVMGTGKLNISDAEKRLEELIAEQRRLNK